MTRKGKKKVEEFVVEQEVIRTGVQAESFDFFMRFTNTVDQPELFMDELVKTILEGLLQQYGQIVVKINWWSKDLQVIAPNTVPGNDLQATQEASTGTIDSNPTPNTE